MPTYDYVCEACGHAFEHFQGISEELLRACPACRKRKLRRLIGSGAGILFKGSGFYETDYKRAAQPGGGEGEAKGEPQSTPRSDPAQTAETPTGKPAKPQGETTPSGDGGRGGGRAQPAPKGGDGKEAGGKSGAAPRDGKARDGKRALD